MRRRSIRGFAGPVAIIAKKLKKVRKYSPYCSQHPAEMTMTLRVKKL
jgi:hypothetical protein